MTMGSIDHGKLGHEPKEKKKLTNFQRQQFKAKDSHSNAAIGFIFGEIQQKNVISVACGFQHTVALTDQGEVYTWG